MLDGEEWFDGRRWNRTESDVAKYVIGGGPDRRQETRISEDDSGEHQ